MYLDLFISKKGNLQISIHETTSTKLLSKNEINVKGLTVSAL